MKRTVFIILLFSSLIFTQQKPNSFYLVDDNKLNKSYNSNSDNPIGNSVDDIVTVGDTIWLGTSRGLSVSYDKGENWKNFSNSLEFGTESISAIAYYKGIIAVATAHSVNKDNQDLPEGSGIKLSTNNGKSWIIVPQMLDAATDTLVQYGINYLRALPVTVAIQNLTYDITFSKNTIWAASFAGGLRKINIDTLLSNPKAKWERVVLPPDRLNSIKPTDSLNFCLAPVGGKFCSDNNLNYRLFSVQSVEDTIIYAGSAGGINKSTDNGISWVRFTSTNQNNHISGNFIVAMGYNRFQKTLWAATWRAEGNDEFYGISYTSDGGNNWFTSLVDEKVHNFGTDNGISKQYVTIAAADNNIYRTEDQGKTWIAPINIIDSKTKIKLKSTVFYSAAIQDTLVFLGSDNGLVRFSQRNANSYWNGGSWKIYIASSPLRSKSETYCFPNPFSPKTDVLKIKYTTGGNSENVTIRIYNFALEPVRTIIQNAPRGSYYHATDNFQSVNEGIIDTWDGKDDNGRIVPNGTYFYSVKVDSNKEIFNKIIVLQ